MQKKQKRRRDHDEDDAVTKLVRLEGKDEEKPIDSITNSTERRKVSKADFFAQLTAIEAAKPRIGTVHATGKKDENEKKDASKDWDCHKCSYKNFKECLTCAKCRALRRFEGRNQAYGYCQ